jgi:small subunit ribosomal protein S7
MSRKGRKASKRETVGDQKFNSVLITRFINNLMHEGKKSVAERIFYQALDQVGAKVKDREPAEVFEQALENVKPMVEVKSRRVGGANYQIPVEVATERRQALAIRWVLDAARKRGEKTMTLRLANEILDAYNRTGSAVKKREDTHRMAEANKAFAHYRW